MLTNLVYGFHKVNNWYFNRIYTISLEKEAIWGTIPVLMSFHIEGRPFVGTWDKIGDQRNSADSCVGVLRGTETVIKWSRIRPSSREDLLAMCKFKKRSDTLYRAALGEDFIVPSTFVAGQKRNGKGMEYKPYIIQPYINSWTGRTIPTELRNSRTITDQWAVLYSRLYYFYLAADEINRGYREEDRFPITITVGSTRQVVKDRLGGENVIELPKTNNILIEKVSKRLFLCDFGEYARWTDNMDSAYRDIITRTSLRNG